MFLICLIFQYLWYTIFLVVSVSVLIKRFSVLPTLEQATYDCPCEKQSVCKYKPQNSKNCPCALLIVIADANQIGNCNLIKWNDISVGIKGIRWSRHLHHWNAPSKLLLLWCWSLIFYWKTWAITKLGLVNLSQQDNWHIIKYLWNGKIHWISIMKKKFKNKFLE